MHSQISATDTCPTPIRADSLTRERHGFFTRIGGVSEGVYAGLNCGAGSDDAPPSVAQNRARVAAHFGLDGAALISMHQCHSAEVAVVAKGEKGARKCDAMVSADPDVLLGILTADCAPVLFEDRQTGIVGAAHAGWRGAVGGVLEATLDAMVELGSDRASISAVVGPLISQSAYEVGPEFVEAFLDEDPDYARFFAGGHGDRAQFDLPGFVLQRLRGAGVGEASWTGHCTYEDAARFFSYRRNCHEGLDGYGRLIAVIRAGRPEAG